MADKMIFISKNDAEETERDQDLKNDMNFETLWKNKFPDQVHMKVTKSKKNYHLDKPDFTIPSSEDVTRLTDYLKQERKRCREVLLRQEMYFRMTFIWIF